MNGKQLAFLNDLLDLYAHYDLAVGSCGCCASPYIEKETGTATRTERIEYIFESKTLYFSAISGDQEKDYRLIYQEIGSNLLEVRDENWEWGEIK
jgi:hypothetical protein